MEYLTFIIEEIQIVIFLWIVTSKCKPIHCKKYISKTTEKWLAAHHTRRYTYTDITVKPNPMTCVKLSILVKMNMENFLQIIQYFVSYFSRVFQSVPKLLRLCSSAPRTEAALNTKDALTKRWFNLVNEGNW